MVDHTSTPSQHQQALVDLEGTFGRARFANRELSRLQFADRLLDLAADQSQLILDRVKFTAIYADLVDEFFQVRVANLEDQIAAGVTTRSPDGLRPKEQLKAVRGAVSALIARQDALVMGELLPGLSANGIRLVEYRELTDLERADLAVRFEREIFPILTPLSVDVGHPFPYISDRSINLLVRVRDPKSQEVRVARVKVPDVLPRFFALDDDNRFITLEAIIAEHLARLFPGMEVGQWQIFRITRNADLVVEEDEADDLLVALEAELRRRRFGHAVRLEVAEPVEPGLLDTLLRELDLRPDQCFSSSAPLGLSALWAIASLDEPELKAEPWTPLPPAGISTAEGGTVDLFQALRSGDLLVQHPYDSFAMSVEAFIGQAADDPNVLGIKQTLYRTSGNSPIIAALIRAAEQGKQVAAFVELKARFDEAANIGWAKTLEDAGVHVVYGLVGLKTHSKTAMVLRREADGIARYCHIGTGNYNSKTARQYEDLGLFTADPKVGEDVGQLFNYLTGFSHHVNYERLLVSPITLRSTIVDKIHAQRAHGPQGRIRLKLNGLTDPAIIDALYQASAAGVQISLCVRSLCCVRAQVPGLSDNISVRSIAGEFLEHSRIYGFGSPSTGGEELFIGSADLMERNLDRRIEVLTPILSPPLSDRLSTLLDLVFHDDQQSWILQQDGSWVRQHGPDGISLQSVLKVEAKSRSRRWLEMATDVSRSGLS